MATTSITIRMDESLKKQAENLFEDMGMNMTTAFTVFTKAAVRQGKIPFEVAGSRIPNADTIAAMKEADQIAQDPSRKGYASAKELFSELRAECTE